MNTDKKFCTNCGEELDIDTRFCTECGHDLEAEDLPVEETTEEVYVAPEAQEVQEAETYEEYEEYEEEEVETASSFDFKNIDFKNFDIKDLNNKQWGIIGGVLLLLLVIIYFAMSGVSIAGTYENADTLMDPIRHDTLTISRNGRATLDAEDTGEGMSVVMKLHLVEHDGFPTDYSLAYGPNPSGIVVYRIDHSKEIDLEMTFYSDNPSDFNGNASEMYMVGEMFGLDIEIEGNYLTISGTVTSAQAYAMDLELDDFELVEVAEGRLMLGDDMYIEQ